jgi:acyl carrier protein
MKKKLYKILENIDKRIKIKNYSKNLEVGQIEYWDSLSHLNFLISIEEKFKIKFTIDEMTNIKSIDEIEKALKKKEKK